MSSETASDLAVPHSAERPRLAVVPLAFASALLALLLLPGLLGPYGPFIDELYYVSCAERPAAGYVDHPPLFVWVLDAHRAVFGDSLFALRSLPAAAGATVVFLTGLMTARMGGGPYAQGLAMLALMGALDNISVVIRHTLLLTYTPDAMRGRVQAVSTVFIGTSNELGGFESGVMAGLLGPVGAVVFGGLGTLAVVGLIGFKVPALRRLREIGDQPLPGAKDQQRRPRRCVFGSEFAPASSLSRRTTITLTMIIFTITGAVLLGAGGGAMLHPVDRDRHLVHVLSQRRHSPVRESG